MRLLNQMLANGMPVVVLCLISSVVYVEAFSFQFLKSSADEGKSTKLEASSVNDIGENDLQPDHLEQDYSQKRSIPSKKAVVGSTSNVEPESEGEKTFTIWDALDISNREDSAENITKIDNSSSLSQNTSVQVKQEDDEEEDSEEDDDDDDDEPEKPKPVNAQDVPNVTLPKVTTPLNVLPSGELNLDVGGQVNGNTSVQQSTANNQTLNNTEEPQTGGPDPYVFGNTSNIEQPSNTSQSETPVNAEGTNSTNGSDAVPNNQTNVSVEVQSNSSISNQSEAINQTGPVSSNQSAVVEGEFVAPNNQSDVSVAQSNSSISNQSEAINQTGPVSSNQSAVVEGEFVAPNNQSDVSVAQSNSSISNQSEAINQTGPVSSNQSAVVEGEIVAPNNQSDVSVAQSNSSISNQSEAINQTGPVSSNQSAVVEGELGLSVNISNSTLPAENATQPESSGVIVEVDVLLGNITLNGTNSTAGNVSEPSSVGNVSNSDQINLNISVSENSTVSGGGEIFVTLNVSQPANVSLTGDVNSTLSVNGPFNTSEAAGNNESIVNVSVTGSANTSSNLSDVVESITTVIVGDNPEPVALNVSETIPLNSTQSQNNSTANLDNTLVFNVSAFSNTSSAENISIVGYKNKTTTPFNITLLDISGNADSQKTDTDLQSESNLTVVANQSVSVNSSASGNSSASSNTTVEPSGEVSKNNTNSDDDVEEDANVRVKRKTVAKRSVNPILVERRKRDSYKQTKELYNEEADHMFNSLIN